jgi:DNA-binding SARP family transcriptional activator
MDEARYEVRVLGGFAVLRDGIRLPPVTGVQGQALKVVATLGPMHVESLSDVLWPGHESGRTRLRNVLARVRAAAGPLLQRTEEVILLAPGTTVDAAVFEALARRALGAAPDDPRAAFLARSAYESYGGELLPQDRYQEWCTAPREHLSRRFVHVTERLVEHVLAAGRTEEAVTLLEELIELEPHFEDRYLDLAEVLVSVGRLGRALECCRRARATCERLEVPVPPRCLEIERRSRLGSSSGGVGRVRS